MITERFCACGNRISSCDGSRAGCATPQDLARLDEEDAQLERDRERMQDQLTAWRGRGRLGR